MPIDSARSLQISRASLAKRSCSRRSAALSSSSVGNTGSAAIWLALDECRRHLFAPGEAAVILGAESTNYSFGGFVYEHA